MAGTRAAGPARHTAHACRRQLRHRVRLCDRAVHDFYGLSRPSRRAASARPARCPGQPHHCARSDACSEPSAGSARKNKPRQPNSRAARAGNPPDHRIASRPAERDRRRGGGDGEIAGGASATDVAASASSSPDLMREEGDPALQPRAQEASSDGNEPGPATEPSAQPPNKTVRKTRERTRSHADRSRRERSTTYAAARERQGPAYPTVSETASWY